jgi:pimeloyl-ACP methyl ester carboxylesterase
VRPDIVLALPPAIPVVGDLMRYTVSPLLFRASWPLMVKRLFAPAKVPAQFWHFPAWMTLRPFQLRTNAAEIAQVAPAAMKLSRRYRELSVPLVIIAGSEDRLVHTDTHSERLHAELPQADFRRIEGMGHMLYHLVPDQVMEGIDAAARLGSSSGMSGAMVKIS